MEDCIWQQYIQQIESLSPESKVSRFCKEARFMRVVEVGQCYSVQNQFERFRGFLELIRRFEFELRRRENYIF